MQFLYNIIHVLIENENGRMFSLKDMLIPTMITYVET